MIGLRGRQRREWAGELRELAAFAGNDSLDAQRFAERTAELLRHFSGTLAAAYRPVRSAVGFDLPVFSAPGITEQVAADYRALLGSLPVDARAFHYDPSRLPPEDRNSVRTLAATELQKLSPAVLTFYERYGLRRAAQTRALLARGSTLIGWVGVFREEPGAETARDEWLVTSLARKVRGALSLLQQLSPGGYPLVEAALEALRGDAYLVVASGRVLAANSRGLRRLHTRRAEVVRGVGEALVAFQHGGWANGVDVHPVRGRAARFVVHVPPPPEVTLADQLDLARARWNLTSGQLTILNHLAEGKTNKEIAEELAVSARTVEVHVNALSQKAAVSSRLELVARMWRLR